MKRIPPKHRHNYVSDHVEEVDICNASSAMDCTGLIPSLPQSDFEVESYREVYDFAPPEPKNSES